MAHHWIDSAVEMPESARTHFHRYQDIRTAWEKCPNGIYLMWLAMHFNPAERQEVLHIASVGVSRLRSALDAHFRSLKTADRSDPLTRAYRDVIAEVSAVTEGTVDRTSRRPPAPQGVAASYESYRADAVLVIADALRDAMHPPER
jgi:hypothetical protein